MTDFMEIDQSRVLYRNEHFFIIRDAYPVSPGHLLIISKWLRKDYYELTQEEQMCLAETLQVAKDIILRDYQPDGFNIGMNCGAAAGQTVFHFHCHLIPRYAGDMSDPRGGIRHCIPSKGYYAQT
jgi:diadenosine tetraphosphate (Ap4A) HIT family hydrolase